MKTLFAAACCAAFLTSLASAPAFAQEKKAPSEAQKKQQERMKSCNDKAAGKKGDERKAFMSSCLKGEDGKMTAQQSKMASCNKDAGARKLKGEERKKFMSDCLKAK
jgi:hypothetical protein